MLDDKIGGPANDRARKLADEINDKATAAGCTSSSCRVHGEAHMMGTMWRLRYTGHIELRFEALTVAGPRRRSVNDCKRPIDADKIVKLLVELQGYYDRQDAERAQCNAADAAWKSAADKLRVDAPKRLEITSSASGIHLHADSLTAAQARAIVDALKVLP